VAAGVPGLGTVRGPGHDLVVPEAEGTRHPRHRFFPSLISAPFEHGLRIAFDFAIVACLIAAVASLLRGRKYVHGAEGVTVSDAAAADDREPITPGEPVPAARPRQPKVTSGH
jgi:hypothetical protein